MQLVGLGLVYAGVSSREAGATAIALVLAYKLAPLVSQEHGVLPALRRAKASVQKEFQGAVEHVQHAAPALHPPDLKVFSRRRKSGDSSTPRAHAPAGHPHVDVGAVPSFIAQPPPGTPISPLVHRGLVLNADTGKTIQIGKGTYNRLVDAGYVMDPVAGTITPPPSGAHAKSGGGAKSSGGSGSGRRRRSRSRSSVG